MSLGAMPIFTLALGILAIIFHQPIGRKACQQQSKFLKRELNEKIFTIAYLILGLVFTTASIIAMLGIFPIGHKIQ